MEQRSPNARGIQPKFLKLPIHTQVLKSGVIITAVLGILLLTTTLRAQPMDTTGRWKEFSMPFAVDTFYVRYYGFGPLFFSDSLTGYWLLYSRRKYPDTAGQGVYRTKDAGATWHRWADKTPFPHEQKGAWAIGKSGFRSSDSGRTWERIGVRGTDSAQTIAYGSFSNAGLPKVMAALYAYRPTRLAFTLDGGAPGYSPILWRNEKRLILTTRTMCSATTLSATQHYLERFRWQARRTPSFGKNSWELLTAPCTSR
ncbi:MAG: hypothetical protein UZ07_CHB004003388 [Chlorobi bacterium OLB7]|nr:MAG: hypothetical protein UZ07_CHB004003388 [Chlorobi bacterium OLB7]